MTNTLFLIQVKRHKQTNKQTQDSRRTFTNLALVQKCSPSPLPSVQLLENRTRSSPLLFFFLSFGRGRRHLPESFFFFGYPIKPCNHSVVSESCEFLLHIKCPTRIVCHSFVGREGRRGEKEAIKTDVTFFKLQKIIDPLECLLTGFFAANLSLQANKEINQNINKVGID